MKKHIIQFKKIKYELVEQKENLYGTCVGCAFNPPFDCAAIKNSYCVFNGIYKRVCKIKKVN